MSLVVLVGVILPNWRQDNWQVRRDGIRDGKGGTSGVQGGVEQVTCGGKGGTSGNPG